MTYRWWEKTVEYQFVINAVNSASALLLVPLNDTMEKTGDLLLQSDIRFVMIEFKKDLDAFKSEYDKYYDEKTGFDRAKIAADEFVTRKNIALPKHETGSGHLLVYGKVDKPAPGKQPVLQTLIVEYFDLKKPRVDIQDALRRGFDSDQLDTYLIEFLPKKKSKALPQVKKDEAKSKSSDVANVKALDGQDEISQDEDAGDGEGEGGNDSHDFFETFLIAARKPDAEEEPMRVVALMRVLDYRRIKKAELAKELKMQRNNKIPDIGKNDGGTKPG